ncbi:CLUMA_CG008357, isoform A [Clunio marinus]|uniref:CLUMA_CG008357, isoform A n=1 Tax=Clunio marinus TaxID=568069 RepID=A0A1J1I8W4_9DIPT|nr:CLUMA_CG008357, isoform A [Clunio marinus]
MKLSALTLHCAMLLNVVEKCNFELFTSLYAFHDFHSFHSALLFQAYNFRDVDKLTTKATTSETEKSFLMFNVDIKRQQEN